MLDNIPNYPSKFGGRNEVEINDESREIYNISNQIKFKTAMIRSNLCDYSDAYIYVKGNITVLNTGTARAPDTKKAIFKNCAPFIDHISKISNT